MTASTNGYTESTIHVGGTGVTLLRGGSGAPLLVLHEELGHPGWLAWHQDLAQDRRSLLLPVHPGFGQLPRADWIANVRDLAGFYSRMLREMALGPVDVIGFSLGGLDRSGNGGGGRRAIPAHGPGCSHGGQAPGGRNPRPLHPHGAGLSGRQRTRRRCHPGIRVAIRRRNGGAVRGLGGRPGRVCSPGLEALYAQSQPAPPAGGACRDCPP